MAKIHTVEWTPAIIAHPTTKFGDARELVGLLGERLAASRAPQPNEVLSGIPGSPTNHHGVPYSLTEEFVAVYRMHPLLPDDFTFRSIATDDGGRRSGRSAELGALDDARAGSTRSAGDALLLVRRSRTRARSRCTTTRASCRSFERPDGTVVDLAAIDILRDPRARRAALQRVPRLFHLKPAATFEELTDNPQWARGAARGSTATSSSVDLMVGLYAEPLPQGFGFSDTAFRVFILMASRRLKSDRFFTRDYTRRCTRRPGSTGSTRRA